MRTLSVLMLLVTGAFASPPAETPRKLRTAAVVFQAPAPPIPPKPPILIDYKSNYVVGEKIKFTLRNISNNAKVQWGIPDGVASEYLPSNPNEQAIAVWADAGTYETDGMVVDSPTKSFDDLQIVKIRFKFTVQYKTPPPTPVPPTPVPPGPGPTPPDPSPIPDAGLRVLIIYETADLSKLPTKQLDIIYSDEIRKYLESVVVKGDKGPERRIWDKDLDVSGDSAPMGKMFARPRKEIPWVVIANGKTGYEGPLPVDAASFRALVEKYKQ